MLRSTILTLLFASLVACGSEIEPSSADANAPPSPGGAPEEGTPENEPQKTPAPAVAALVRLKNTSAAPRFVVVDAQSTPVDFEVGVPPMQLNGYGSYWCGGPTTNHNDPMARVVRVEPGEVAEIHWRPISVTREGDCWKGTPLSGAYPTKACFYESVPDGIMLPGDEAVTVPLVCVDVTLTVPASGETVLDF